MKGGFEHIPVLLNECIDGLNIKPQGTYVDGTVGGAGHSLQIAKRLKGGKLVVFDKDESAIAIAKERLSEFDNVLFIKSDFKNFAKIMAENNINKVDGVLLDLGISSHQIDTPERGFSYRFDGGLDMRMDANSESITAYDVVNNYSESGLLKILYTYGEEKFAKPIVRNIIKKRQISPIKTTLELKEIIEEGIPKNLFKGRNMVQKSFQAIRIEVNKELENLESAIRDMVNALNIGGRLAIISFHGLEDKIVKNTFKELSKNCICDKKIPICVCKHIASIKLINNKPIIPSDKELTQNKRSSSAKLRVVEKI